MFEKLKVVKERRQWTPYTLSNPIVQSALYRQYAGLILNISTHSTKPKRFPNILLILADDLGYADLSVPPFNKADSSSDLDSACSDGGILTPNLEKMTFDGMILTNFHSASPVCSPSRVAIMTSLYPWRLNAMNAFELGQVLSQRHGFLPQVLTTPEIFREAGYYTAHSGMHIGFNLYITLLKRFIFHLCFN